MATNISWTDETWNPTVGCSLVSPGCTNCYAMKAADGLQRKMKGKRSHYDGTTKLVNGKPVWTGHMALAPDHILLKPLHWKKPRTVFVNSMSDLFHPYIDMHVVAMVFGVMAVAQQHIYQILTKRPDHMHKLLTSKDFWQEVNMYSSDYATEHTDVLNRRSDDYRATTKDYNVETPLPNVWLGVSCEDQTRADERIPDLLATPAAVRFVSAEPLLGPIDFTSIDYTRFYNTTASRNVLTAEIWIPGNAGECSQTYVGTEKIHWIISGGESGSIRRNTEHVVDHIIDIDRQCEAAGVAHFVKQDAAFKSGQQGRIPDHVWAKKQFPEVKR